MAVKSLKQLLNEADGVLGTVSHTKSASATSTTSDDIANVAERLINAGALEKVAEVTSTEANPQFEKLALVVNRAEAFLQIEHLKKLAQFEKAAKAQGYTDEQIGEEISKIAAKETKTHLPILTALGLELMSNGEDKNSLQKKKVPVDEIGQNKRQKNSTEGLGYGV